MNLLDEVLTAQKSGRARGLPSICSAHPLVLEAALRYGLRHHTPVLIEATCNQVNQFGGYTGLTPQGFQQLVAHLAGEVGFPVQDILLGGDHLGPLPWVGEPSEQAMTKAMEMVRACILAGYQKIHLDCSTPCSDDRELTTEEMASRAARLAAVAEDACRETGRGFPRYVIGTEVPRAGGATAEEKQLTVTRVEDAAETIRLTHQAFIARGLEAAWERVIALVVQPGVEFGRDSIHEYDRRAAKGLKQFIETIPGLVYEAHSTDYQSRPALKTLVEDHFAILKVGPALTFALREAIFALAEIEEALCAHPSRIRQVIEDEMLADPTHWVNHYPGSPPIQKLFRQYSFSDRIRYYWAALPVQAAMHTLLENLGDRPLPLGMLSQFFPEEYRLIRGGDLPNQPHALLLSRVERVLDDYQAACDG